MCNMFRLAAAHWKHLGLVSSRDFIPSLNSTGITAATVKALMTLRQYEKECVENPGFLQQLLQTTSCFINHPSEHRSYLLYYVLVLLLWVT